MINGARVVVVLPAYNAEKTYGLGVLGTAIRYRLHRWGLRRDPLFDPQGKRLESAPAVVPISRVAS